MNKFSSAVLALFAAVTSQAASIDQVIVRQQWPWSTDIKVEYRISGIYDIPQDITVRAYEGDTPLALPDYAISGVRYNITTDRIGTINIDAAAAFGFDREYISNLRIELSAGDSSGEGEDVLYKIVNLTTGAIEDVTRAALLNGEWGPIVTNFSDLDASFSTSVEDVLIWTGVTNIPAFKPGYDFRDTHMVFRRIPAKNKTFRMGNVTGRNVTLTNDFYMGVFEVTQAQYARYGAHPAGTSNETNAQYKAYRPVDRMYFWSGMRDQKVVPAEGRLGDRWPDGDHQTLGNGYFKWFQNLTHQVFDLPTEAMWEFACRAGCEPNAELYTNENSSDVASAKIMRCRGINCVNEGSTAVMNCDLTDGPAWVGSYLPNAYGLYDMLGNVWEMCLDRYAGLAEAELTDPRGPALATNSNTSDRVTRGGSYRRARNGTLVYTRSYLHPGENERDQGFRVCFYSETPYVAPAQ